MPATLRKRLIICCCLLVALIATGCGVRVEVADPSTHQATFFDAADTLFDKPIARQVAAPRLVFSANQPEIELFAEPKPPDLLLIRDHPFRVAVNYDATWFKAAQGSAVIKLKVYTRSDSEQDWTLYESAERELVAATTPDTVHDALAIKVISGRPGQLNVRAEFEITTSDSSSAAHNGSAEFIVYILSVPINIVADPQALILPNASLDPASLLLDYRAWRGGPCSLIDLAKNDPALISIQASCKAVEANDAANAIKSAQQAVTLTQNLALSARLYDMLGVAHIRLGNLADAGASLNKALEKWGAQDRIWELSISFHNWAVTLALAGERNTASILFAQLIELHSQFQDEPGRALTLANLGHLSGNRAMLEKAQRYFEHYKLPQAEVVNNWIIDLGPK